MPRKILEDAAREILPESDGPKEKVTVGEGHNIMQRGILYAAGEQVEVTPSERRALEKRGALKGCKNTTLSKILSDEDIENAVDAKAADHGVKVPKGKKYRGRD